MYMLPLSFYYRPTLTILHHTKYTWDFTSKMLQTADYAQKRLFFFLKEKDRLYPLQHIQICSFTEAQTELNL